MDDYCKLVLEEKGYHVFLSNLGKKPKKNPNPITLEKKMIKCVIGCGAETKNQDGVCTQCKKKKEKPHHKVDWIGTLVPPGYSFGDCSEDVLPHFQIIEMLIKWANKDDEKAMRLDSFVDDVLKSIVSNIPDATTLQKNIGKKIEDGMNVDEFVLLIKKLVDKHFPLPKYGKHSVVGGKFKGKALNKIPLRIVAALLILAFGCEESNRGDAWFCKIHGRGSKYGNAYMPSVYYFLRRHTNATEEQARMCLKG